MGFLSGVWNWFTGNSVTSQIAKVAMLGYASRLLNEETSSDKTDLPDAVDPGVRLQLNPSTETKIPVLYGDAFFGGNIVDAAISSDNKTMWYVLALAETTGTKYSDSNATSYTFHDVYLNNNRVVFKSDGYTVDYTLDQSSNQDINMRDLVKVYLYVDGVPTQPDGETGTTPAAHTLISHWDAINYAMDGLIFAIVEVNYNQTKGVSGLPQCTFNIETNMTKPGDVLYDYMTNNRYGANIATADIDTTSITAINTYSDTGFSYTDKNAVGQTGNVTINGLVDTKTQCLRNMEEMCEAVNSWLSYDIHEGKWKVIINDTTASSATITDSHIIGEIGITGTSLTQLYNAVDVQYQNTDIKDKTDFVKIEIDALDLFDNEPRTTLQLKMPFTNKQAVAMKVGLIALKQARADKIITFRTDYSFINLKAGEVVTITSSSASLNAAPFRIMNVKQVEGTNGEIQCEFTALEYLTAVYDYDITEFNVETDSGILGIGTIGKPDIPVTTNNSSANMPHVLIESEVPSGIVDTMEFWLTYDTTEPNDALRNYVHIGSQSNTGGALYSENDDVDYRYNSLQTADFYVKVRGTNAMAVGPFSDPSGLIEFVPEVVGDTLSDVPVDFGGQLMSLGLLTLLNHLDTLMDIFTGDVGIMEGLEQIFFPGSTEPTQSSVADHLLADQNFIDSLPIPDELNDLSDVSAAAPTVDDFLVYDGANWVPSANAPSGVNAIDDLTDVDTSTVTPNVDDILVWDGTNWVPQPGCCDTDLDGCELTIGGMSPVDDYTASALDDTVSIWFNTDDPLDPNGILENSGSVYLYTSDGTLIETKTAAQCTFAGWTITIPFTNRVACTDYYILMDRGVGKDCNGCLTPRICLPTTWNFTTTTDDLPVVPSVPYNPTYAVDDPDAPSVWTPTPAINQVGESTDCQATFTGRSGDVELTFNQEVKPGLGQLHIKDGATTVHSFESCEIFADGNIEWTEDGYTTTGVIPSFFTSPDKTYNITIDANFVSGRIPECPNSATAVDFTPDTVVTEPLQGPSNNETTGSFTSSSGHYEFGTHGNPAVGTGNVYLKDRNTGAVIETKTAADATLDTSDALEIVTEKRVNCSPNNGDTEVSRNTNITIQFNKTIIPQTGNFYLYKGATLVQTFDITTKFTDDMTSGIIRVGTDTVVLNPTECLEAETVYHIRWDANVVKSICQLPLAAQTDDSALSFTTISKVTPTMTFPTLAPNANQSINETGIIIDAPGSLAPGSGSLFIYDENDNLIETITAGDSRVSIN